jgi:DNA-binding response OmpR family regulator
MEKEAAPQPTILVVGNERDACDLLQRMLSHVAPSYACVTTDDAEHALMLLAERPVVLAIVHVRLVDMGGLPIATAIKTRSPTTCVVLLSAMDQGDLKHHTQVLKLDGYVAKPFTVADVAQTVRVFLP